MVSLTQPLNNLNFALILVLAFYVKFKYYILKWIIPMELPGGELNIFLLLCVRQHPGASVWEQSPTVLGTVQYM